MSLQLSAENRPLTLGTAGHIDHGKTVLVEALTGVNTDRLPAERERGISIELGYASLELPSRRALSIVDVPGHERFVRTMVAGATGIDLFLLVVAADDGVMPQTREHLSILELLDIPAGAVALTKVDVVGEERIEQAARELRKLLADGRYEDTPVVPVCAPTGYGLAELVATLDDIAGRFDQLAPGQGNRAGANGEPRLHVDRSFSLTGIGTVVTGTLWSGVLRVGDRVRIEPSKRNARIRSIEVHGERRDQAGAGQRVAANLAGVHRREVDRGDLLTAPDGEVRHTYLVDAAVELLAGTGTLARGARVQLHHGTRATPVRVAPIDGDLVEPGVRSYVQLRLEQPIMPAAGDRFVLRQVAPPTTIGGGIVIDPSPRKHGAGAEHVDRLASLEAGEPTEHLEEALSDEQVERARRRMLDAATQEPADPRAQLLIDLLLEDGIEPRGVAALSETIGISPDEAHDLLKRCFFEGEVVRVKPALYFHPEALEQAANRVVALCERDGSATIASLRDDLGTSRKYAQALLEHFDASRLTHRRGDEHVLRRGQV